MDRGLTQGFEVDIARANNPTVHAVIALGSNLGDRAGIIDAALSELGRMPLTDGVNASSVIESVALKPGGPDAEAPAYLNCVAILTTRLAPSVLLSFLQAIEVRHGRPSRELQRAGDPKAWEDRTLDLDIIAYGDLTSSDPGLTLPHPRAAERDFVLAPWLEIDPDAELPGHGRVDAILERLRGAP